MSKPLQTDPGHFIDNPVEFARANIDMLKKIAIELTEASQRHQILRIEAVRAALSENAKRYKSVLNDVSDTAALFEKWSTPLQTRMQKFTEMGHDWIEVTSHAFAGMGEAIGQSFSAPGERMKKMALWETPVVLDRRISASVITFPERRATGGETQHAESGHPVAKRRHVA